MNSSLRLTPHLSLKIMLTGKNGQVGWELQRTLAPLGQVIALGRQDLDLADPGQIRERVREIKPDIIVNAAAYTAVDKAEEEPELAMSVNGIAPGILAEEAKLIDAAIVHYSTDYVFNGQKNSPYTEEDEPEPLNVYGKTKLAGEQAIKAVGVPYLILRTSWVYGMRGKNFLLTILRLAWEREELRVVDDQIGSPTWSRMVAEATAQILARVYSPLMPYPSLLTDVSGIYHLSAGGHTSWYGFTKEIIKYASRLTPYSLQVSPIPSADYPAPARRPAYSVLSNLKLKETFGVAMPDWELLLKIAIEES
ncbi:dTDP-4-dehydrorhamnose reductase [Desulfoscipio geothermicus]|uniref:dTDP-4-dehydrorhamnose reductase n=1 Tax=Desulfoscipio geothermicus DSM 3669 TaxID=1121426 RepID=A0A1I6E8W8_9FIRM|nr:dTDP-4-dehydrorhamnose reductase [Desulfoscipio geothermicus]SFR14185.1 dTDP-4-dehydrorhamnose reductase [Desulfoscipio geothermicus DSM 3669]